MVSYQTVLPCHLLTCTNVRIQLEKCVKKDALGGSHLIAVYLRLRDVVLSNSFVMLFINLH